MQETLNLDQFRTAFQAGGLQSVSVRASGGFFVVVASPRSGEQVVLAKTHGVGHRSFRDPGKAIEVLHAMGARKVEGIRPIGLERLPIAKLGRALTQQSGSAAHMLRRRTMHGFERRLRKH